jgi:hypothetical protein
VQVEARLIPINAVLDLALADGLNPAPLAAADWRVACLEVPVLTELGTVVCDVVLFNASIGHLLVVEAKSGANIEEGQARRLAAIDPQALIIAGGITIPQAVQLRIETLFACLTKHAARITKGISAAGLATPVIAVDADSAQLPNPALASEDLASALGGTTVWAYPIARIIPFDHESPAHLFDGPVRAELVAQMARHRPSVTMRALTEQVVSHFPLYGRRAQGQLVRKVTEAARRAAREEPERLQFEPGTGTTEPRVVVLRSPEDFDRRGRTQGYQAVFSGRSRKKPLPEVPGQMDLFTELDRAESVATDDTGQNDSSGSDDVRGGERQ